MTEDYPNRFYRSDLDEAEVEDSVKTEQAPVPRESNDERKKLATGSISLLKNLMVANLDKKCPTFYGTRIFIIVFTRARYYILSSTRLITLRPV
jgi:hypothetical protein